MDPKARCRVTCQLAKAEIFRQQCLTGAAGATRSFSASRWLRSGDAGWRGLGGLVVCRPGSVQQDHVAYPLHILRAQTLAYFGDNDVPLLAILRGNADFHEFMVFEREINLPQHCLGQPLGTETYNGPQLLAFAAQFNEECFFQHGDQD